MKDRATTVTADRLATAALWAVGLGPAVFAVFVSDRAQVKAAGVTDWGVPAAQPAQAPWQHAMGQAYTFLTIGLLLAGVLFALTAPRPTGPRGGGPLVGAGMAMYAGPLLSGLVGGHGGAADWRLWLPPLAVGAVYLAPPVPPARLMRQLRVIFRVYTWGSLGALAIAPGWASIPIDIVNFRLPWVGSSRLVGLTDHPILLGVVATAALALELAPVYRARLWSLHAGAALAVVLLAQSRTAWVAALVGLPLLYRRGRRVNPLLVRGLAAGIAVSLALLLPGLPERIGQLLSDHEVSSLHGRTTVWDMAMSTFRSNPTFGYGPTLFTDSSSPNHGAYAHAHSQLYQTLSTSGLVGAAGLLVFVVTLLVSAARSGRVSAGLSWSLVSITLSTCLTEAPFRPLELLSPFLLLVVLNISVLLAGDRAAAAGVLRGVQPRSGPVAYGWVSGGAAARSPEPGRP